MSFLKKGGDLTSQVQWDIHLTINNAKNINIIESVNHKIKVDYVDESRTIALVRLSDEVDKYKAAEKDFVLWFRGSDAKPEKSICLIRHGDRIQSLSIQVIPDKLTAAQRIDAIKKKLAKGDDQDEEEEEEKKQE